ncbi:hypothetical protein [Xanthobacter sediminis]
MTVMTGPEAGSGEAAAGSREEDAVLKIRSGFRKGEDAAAAQASAGGSAAGPIRPGR